MDLHVVTWICFIPNSFPHARLKWFYTWGTASSEDTLSGHVAVDAEFRGGVWLENLYRICSCFFSVALLRFSIVNYVTPHHCSLAAGTTRSAASRVENLPATVWEARSAGSAVPVALRLLPVFLCTREICGYCHAYFDLVCFCKSLLSTEFSNKIT